LPPGRSAAWKKPKATALTNSIHHGEQNLGHNAASIQAKSLAETKTKKGQKQRRQISSLMRQQESDCPETEEQEQAEVVQVDSESSGKKRLMQRIMASEKLITHIIRERQMKSQMSQQQHTSLKVSDKGDLSPQAFREPTQINARQIS